MRKPDGYFGFNSKGKLASWGVDEYIAEMAADERVHIKPGCIVPPELLDWVEEARKGFKLGSFFEMPTDACKDFFDVLEKIWSEEK